VGLPKLLIGYRPASASSGPAGLPAGLPVERALDQRGGATARVVLTSQRRGAAGDDAGSRRDHLDAVEGSEITRVDGRAHPVPRLEFA
jgi:hypothetical protein